MKINAVIKIGGSIFGRKNILLELCRYINKIIRCNYKIIIIAGGGSIADEVRRIYNEYDISDATAHWMAIMAMNINGILISSLNKNLIPVEDIAKCKDALKNRLTPVFLPYKILKKYDSLPKSWHVTSDSVSLYMAHLLGAQVNILLKDVDGIYNPVNKCISIERITARRLKRWKNKTCVDKYLPTLLSRCKINTYVISGYHPERIKNILEGKNVPGTLITP